MKGGASTRRSHPLAARIKRLMQKDDDVGRIACVTPILISRALELFLRKLCTNVIDYAKGKKSRTISPSHLKAYVYSDSNMDFLKSTVKDAPDLTTAEPFPGHLPAKRTRVQSTEVPLGARPKAKGKGESFTGRTSKRQCVPTALADVPATVAPPLFTTGSSFPQRGMEDGSIQQNTTTTLKAITSVQQLNRTETQSMSLLEKQSGIPVMPTMTSAVRTHEAHVDPQTLPINLQKALLHIPSDTKPSEASCLVMPPVSVALSISDVELGVRPKESDTPMSIHDLGSTKQFLNNTAMSFVAMHSSELKAEEDNYDFSEDEVETEDVKKE